MEIETKELEKKIYVIRGVEVMLDSEMSTTKCHDYKKNEIENKEEINRILRDIFKN